jgi:hypothetical protein
MKIMLKSIDAWRWGGSSLLLFPLTHFPFLIYPSHSTCFFLVFFVFFWCFRPHTTTPSTFICPLRCCATHLLRLLHHVSTLASAHHLLHFDHCCFLWFFFFLFILNKDHFGSRKRRSSFLMSKSMLFWFFFCGG